MIYRGHIKNGVVVFDEPHTIPEGAAVRLTPLDQAHSSFWQSKTLDELCAEQSVKPLTSMKDLAGDWPEEDSIDDFLAWIRKVRN
jgi:hypothetical protein